MAEWRNWVVGGSFTRGLFFAGGQGARAGLTVAEGLPDNSITALLVDRDQTLWIGTRGGLAALWPKRVRVFETPGGTFGQRIQSVVPAGTNGIWAATEAGGLFRYDGQWTRAGLQGGRSQVLTALWSPPNRDLWVGSGGGGLMRLAASEWENGSWRVAETGLPNNEFVHCLLQTTPGQLWVGTRSGLFLLSGDGGEKAVSLTLPGVINCLAEDGSGGVWFGTKGTGLGHWQAGHTTYLREADGLPSENIFALYRDPETSGTLWVGTAGAGLVRYQAGRLAVISSRNGLPDDAICQVIADDAGRLWLGTYAGICAVKIADLNACADGRLARLDCLMLNEADGLTTPECSSAQQPACCRTPDGRLWFGTRRGVAVVDPAHIAINTNPAQVWIEPLRTDTGAVPAPGTSGKVALPLGQRRVEFRFAAPSLKAENRISFIHRLAPVETEWSQPDRSHDVIYGALPPGDYTFHVRAANEDGVWSSTDATMAFHLPPHLWERVWFAPASWTGGALAVCGLVLLNLRRRAQRRLERSERQRALERERGRISKDLHDDLGGSLTEVGILAGAAAEGQTSPELRGYLDEINRKSESMIYALDEIIWAINPRHDSVRSFADYLSGHAAEFLGRAGLRLRLDVQQDLPEIQFDSRRRHSCFLAAKEALTNVVRHAAATEVWLHLRVHEGSLRLAIEDNGTGFDPAAASGRHGIQNLHERLTEMGGRCRITRGATGGTQVVLEVPL
jgi:signal transduction histidine kinase